MVFIWGVNRFFVIEIAAFGHMKKDEEILKTVFLFQGINRYAFSRFLSFVRLMPCPFLVFHQQPRAHRAPFSNDILRPEDSQLVWLKLP